MKKEISKVLGYVLIMAMVLCTLPSTVSGAAVRKAPRLSKKKISVQVGKKKTIRVKKSAKKAKWSVKSGKKYIKLSKKKKKSVVVSGKKVGKAVVLAKVGGKKLTCRITVTAKKKKQSQSGTAAEGTPVIPTSGTGGVVDSSALPASNTQTPLPDGTPAPTPGNVAEPTPELPEGSFTEKIDLSSYTAFNVADHCMYDTNVSVFSAADQEYFGFPLAQDLEAGESVSITVKGTNKGELGFRSWLVDATTATCCSNDGLYFFTETGNEAFTVGDFEVTYTLVASAPCSYLFFKGSSYGTNIEDLSIHTIDVTYFGHKQAAAFDPTDEQSAVMVRDSLLSTGNNARIKKVMEKAQNGEDVTLAYIGGSVTEGQGANPNGKCYAKASCDVFAAKYGTGENVHYINAGMSGTPSSLGIVRYERDVLGQMTAGDHPDILFIEFAVNDSGECTNGGAYEGLIRRALDSGSAVVLLFSVFRDNWNMQTTYIPYGEYYDLPMVSMKNAVSSCLNEEGFIKWYFSDAYHPTNEGYKLTASCIENLFDAIAAEDEEEDTIKNLSDLAPMNTDAYAGTTMMGPDTIGSLLAAEDSSLVSFDAGGFSKTDNATGTYLYDSKKQKFEKNWMHGTDSQEEALTATVNCKNLLVVYKLSNAAATGTAELYVDGEKKVTMNGYNKDGWNNATTVLAFNEEEAKEHTIEIRMAEGHENKEFTLLALGYN